jgi:hypothetical protein
MKKTVFAVLLCLAFACVIFAQGQKKKSTAGKAAPSVSADIRAAAAAAKTNDCDDELWNHVYHKARLHIVEKCIEVTGTIRHIKHEKDGDDHIQLTLDEPFRKLLNQRNVSAQANSLVVEPVCQGPDTQADAEAACKDFHSPVDVPTPTNAKVRVKGSFVFDGEANHGWMEIHPVTEIKAE